MADPTVIGAVTVAEWAAAHPSSL